MSAVVRKMFVLITAAAVCTTIARCDNTTDVAVHVKTLNTTVPGGNSSSCRRFRFTLSPVDSSCQVQHTQHSEVNVERQGYLKSHLNQTVYVKLQENTDQWFLLISVSYCEKAAVETIADEHFHIQLTPGLEKTIHSLSHLSWIVAAVDMVNVSGNQSLSPVLMPPRLCSDVSNSDNGTAASNNMLKLILGLTIAGGAVALFALLFITSTYRNRRHCQQERHDMNVIVGNSSQNAVKSANVETLGRQLQVHTFGRALTPEPATSPSQASIIEDPDFYNLLPPLMYSDVLRASTILDNISTRPSSMMSANTYTHRSKSFESALSSDNIDGGSSLMHANALAISLHNIDNQQEPVLDAEEGTSTSV